MSHSSIIVLSITLFVLTTLPISLPVWLRMLKSLRPNYINTDGIMYDHLRDNTILNIGKDHSVQLKWRAPTYSQIAVDNPYVSAAVLIQVGDKFLSVSRKHDHQDMGLPGGKVDPGESREDCAVREVLEETGFKIMILTDHTPFNMVHDGYDVTTFKAKIVGGELGQGVAQHETGRVAFVSKEEMLSGSFTGYVSAMFRHFGV